MRQLPNDPLAGMPTLPTHLPDFVPGVRFTQERAENLDLDPANWLWPNELKLICWLVQVHEKAFTWDASERGRLNETFFPPYKIPTIPHSLVSMQHSNPVFNLRRSYLHHQRKDPIQHI
jgi:hypothetical protein